MSSQQLQQQKTTEQLLLSFDIGLEGIRVTHRDGNFVAIQAWPDGWAFVNTQYQDITFNTMGDALSFATHLLITGDIDL